MQNHSHHRIKAMKMKVEAEVIPRTSRNLKERNSLRRNWKSRSRKIWKKDRRLRTLLIRSRMVKAEDKAEDAFDKIVR